MFWGAEQLRAKLDEGRVVPFDSKRIDGASYRLSVGDEVYISPTTDATDPGTKSIILLKKGEAFTIPPGQFAFLLTEEIVKVELAEIAFISVRAKTKYRGLINVSGFHVDPGFQGRLTFAVFNAGPVAVHLRQGQEIFLIWYAELRGRGNRREPGPYQIQSDWISGIGGKLHSLTSVASSVTEVDRKLGKELDAVRRELAVFRVVAGIAATALIGIIITTIVGGNT